MQDALILIATRARLIVEHCPSNTTGMLSVGLEPSKLEAILNSSLGCKDLSISCYNSPQDCVVSGPLFQLHNLRDFLEDNKVCAATKLAIPYAFHSPTMNCLAGKYTTLAAQVKVRAPRFHIISTLLGQVISPDDTSFPPRDYFVRHLVEPVQLVKGVQAFLSNPRASGMTWLEIGPHFIISPMLRQFPELSTCIVLGSLHKRQNAMSTLSHTFTSLYLFNGSMNWREVFSLYGRSSCISLPLYPFTKSRFWVPFTEYSAVGQQNGDQLGFSLLEKVVEHPGINGLATFEAQISQLQKYMDGHRVAGIALCPASIYLELAFAAATRAMEPSVRAGSIISCRRITFSKSLVLNDDEEASVAVQILINSQLGSFTVNSSTCFPESETIHAQGEIEWISQSETSHRLAAHLPSVLDQIAAILRPVGDQTTETFSARTLYSVIFPRVVQYSQEFQVVKSLTMLSGAMEATATMKLGSDVKKGNFIVHPVFLDGLIHVAGFVSNLHASQEYAYICSQIGSVDFNPAALDYETAYTVFCRLSWLQGEAGIHGEAFAISQGQLVVHVNGIQFQRVRLSALKAGLMTLSHLVPFSPKSPAALPKNSFSSPILLETNLNLRDVERTILGLVAAARRLDVSQMSPDFRLDSLEPLTRLKLNLEINKAFPNFGHDVEGLNERLTVTRLAETIVASPNRPYTALAPASPTSSPETLVSSTCRTSLLKNVFAKVLDIDVRSIAEDDDLTLLGLDSLATIEVTHILQTHYNVNIPISFISSARTINNLHARITDWEASGHSTGSLTPSTPLRSITEGPPKTPLVFAGGRPGRVLTLDRGLSLLQTGCTDKPPLVLIHDGMGLSAPYARILDLKRRVFGLSNPHFSTSQPWSNIHQMAKAYASLVNHEIDGPIILGGTLFVFKSKRNIPTFQI